MGFYALGAKPLVDDLAEAVNTDDCMQAWYADDSSAAGRLTEVKLWWDTLNQRGPKYGHFPKAIANLYLSSKIQLYYLKHNGYLQELTSKSPAMAKDTLVP